MQEFDDENNEEFERCVLLESSPVEMFFFLTRTFFGREAFVTRLCVSFIKEVEGAALFFRARSPHALARLSLHSRFSRLDEKKREGFPQAIFLVTPVLLVRG